MSRWRSRVRRGLDAWRNRLPGGPSLLYVVEGGEWVIDHHGGLLVDRFRRLGLRARCTTTAWGARNRLVHFGSIHAVAPGAGRWRGPHRSNRTVVTWFHLVDGDARIRELPAMSERLDRWHTSCEITRRQLIAHGAPADRITVIPLGVDTARYRPDPAAREPLRAALGIPPDRLVVGSFQKDGVGWGDGREPKRIKGPDLLCDALAALAREFPLTALLTGPARGYVKARLEAAGIPYVHRVLPRPEDLAPLYHALDVYLCSSRVEGGPLGLLEAMASGIAVASTPVGMAPEVIADGATGFLAPVEELQSALRRALGDDDARAAIAARGPAAVAHLDWSILARRYITELYAPLLA